MSIQYKLLMSILLLMISQFCNAETHQKLMQSEYDQKIDQYTAQVNASKKVLDEPNSNSQVDANLQKQAFCSRLDAYQQIEQISKNNIELENANIMLMIAHHFLQKQRQSLYDSGMTEKVFCAVVE